MKTAMQELIDFLEPEMEMGDFSQLPAYEKAKELIEAEKKQIMEAYTLGHCMHDSNDENSAEDYYQQTFKSDE